VRGVTPLLTQCVLQMQDWRSFEELRTKHSKRPDDDGQLLLLEVALVTQAKLLDDGVHKAAFRLLCQRRQLYSTTKVFRNQQPGAACSLGSSLNLWDVACLMLPLRS
jgi:hypothetical protein